MEFVSGTKMLILDLAVIIQKNMIGEIFKDLSSEFWVLEQIQLPWSRTSILWYNSQGLKFYLFPDQV